MRIGLISDTHIPEAAKSLPHKVKDIFKGVDLIMHAGDIYDVRVLDELESVAPVLAAQGDDDGIDVINDPRVKARHSLVLNGLNFWLTHARPAYYDPASLGNNGPIELPDVVIFGHSHFVAVLNSQGILLVNPGSATFPKYQREPGTVAILTLNDGHAETKIIQL